MEAIKQRFLHPPAEFSPMPLWFWNGDLCESEIKRQMLDFVQKGVMGFVLHPRIGIPKAIGYLSDRFMELVRFAVETAREMGMTVVLYDEGMYPSGSAHGMVCRENPRFASRGIFLREEKEFSLSEGQRMIARLALQKTGDAACRSNSIRLLADGDTAAEHETAMVIAEGYTHGKIRGIHEGEDDGNPGAPPSGDILNPEAVQSFIRHTHERYYQVLKPYFGNTVTAMFTDEPKPVGKRAPKDMRAWTWDLENEWGLARHTLPELAALWWDIGEETEAIRKAYDSLIASRLETAFYVPISSWCREHGIALTGHPAHPGDIGLEKLFAIPGQDVVWRWVAPENKLGVQGAESTQAKCASDSARHYGRRRNSSECFGCCGPQGEQWAFTVDDMKWYLDWLFVRGTNLIYPHAFFYAVDTPIRWGERPPDVGPNNIWWKYYQKIADYIKRMSGLMTDFVNQTGLAVLCSGTELPWRLPEQLYERQMEFNYLQDALLLTAEISDGYIRIAQQQYSVIAVEDPTLMTPQVREVLLAFTAQGGKLYTLGQPGCETLEGMVSKLDAAGLRTTILNPAGADIRVTHGKRGNMHIILLTNEGETEYNGQVALGAKGYCERFDAWTGEIIPQVCGSGQVALRLARRSSVAFVIDPGKLSVQKTETAAKLMREMPASIAWTATLPDGTQKPLDALGDWQQWEGLRLFSGTIEYEARFTLQNPSETVWLDLGTVREIAEISVNGSPYEPLLFGPFSIAVGARLRAGENWITVRVTSSKVSFYGNKPWPSGLLGSVRLLADQTER